MAFDAHSSNYGVAIVSILTRLLAALSIAALIPIVASAAQICGSSSTGDYYRVLRTGPGTAYPDISQLPAGTPVSIVRKLGVWLYAQAQLPGSGSVVSGWLLSRYVCR